jgi:hypothetical protein
VDDFDVGFAAMYWINIDVVVRVGAITVVWFHWSQFFSFFFLSFFKDVDIK